jgi:hypothetical protein
LQAAAQPVDRPRGHHVEVTSPDAGWARSS